MNDFIKRILLESELFIEKVTYLDSGAESDVYKVNNNWVKKISKNGEYYMDSIKKMANNPEIFATIKNIKKDSYYMEYVDIDEAFKETQHIEKVLIKAGITNKIFQKKCRVDIDEWVFAIGKSDLSMRNELFNILINVYNKLPDKILLKWINFIKKAKPFIDKNNGIDFSFTNMGLDKKGQIKLIDF